MADCQERNCVMVGLLGADMASAADRNLAFRAYDSAGGQLFTGTAITVALGTVALNTAPLLFDLASNVLEVTTAGIFLVHFQTGAAYHLGPGDGSGTMEAFLEVDTGSGFAGVAGSLVYFNTLPGPMGPASGGGTLVLRLGEGDKLRLRLRREDGADSMRTVAGASWLSVVSLTLLG